MPQGILACVHCLHIFSPDFSLSASQFGPWSLPFLCAVALQRKFTLTDNFWGRRIKEKLISFLNTAKKSPISHPVADEDNVSPWLL